MARPLLCHTPLVVVGRNGSSFDIPNPIGFTPVNPHSSSFCSFILYWKTLLGPNEKVKKGLLPLEILGFSKTKASNPPPPSSSSSQPSNGGGGAQLKSKWNNKSFDLWVREKWVPPMYR